MEPLTFKTVKTTKKKQECDDLYEAIRDNKIEEVQRLVINDPDIIYKKDDGRNNGETAFHVAAEVGNLEIIKILVQVSEKNGFNNLINEGDIYNRTPIFYATRRNDQVEVLDFLLNSGGNINHKDKGGETAIFYATKCKSLDSLELLFKKGAEYNILNGEKKSPLDYSRSLIVKALLLQYGAAHSKSYNEDSRIHNMDGDDTDLTPKEIELLDNIEMQKDIIVKNLSNFYINNIEKVAREKWPIKENSTPINTICNKKNMESIRKKVQEVLKKVLHENDEKGMDEVEYHYKDYTVERINTFKTLSLKEILDSYPEFRELFSLQELSLIKFTERPSKNIEQTSSEQVYAPGVSK